MTWYKAFDKDLMCRGMQYKVGEEYKLEGDPVLCRKGFHYCGTIKNCYQFYPLTKETRICEVEPLGEVVSDKENIKFCTNHIKILKEINPKDLCASDDTSTGFFNSNKYNCGHFNSGQSNVGSHNAGNSNTGDYNSGYSNVGDSNTGNHNVGDCNIGDHNIGAYNTGNFNSGSYNSGNCNSGSYNSGHHNSGAWNCGSHSSGIFNTDKKPKIRIFDKESNWTLEDWYESRAYTIMRNCPHSVTYFRDEFNMSNEEKAEHPEYTTIGGYLKKAIATKEDKQKWWDNLPEEDKQAVYDLPNFDADKFEKCTGIKVNFDSKPDDRRIEIERITEINFIRKESEAVNDIQKLQK